MDKNERQNFLYSSISSQNLFEFSPNTIYSVDDAYLRISANPLTAWIVLREIIEKDLCGSPVAFCRIINVLRTAKNYEAAFELCKFALSRFQYDSRLYIVLLKIGTELGNPARHCQEYVNRLWYFKSPWNLDLSLAVFNYYYSVVEMNILGDFSNEFQLALKVIQNVIERFPYEEAGYFYEAQLFLLSGDYNSAERILRAAIFEPPNPDEDSRRYLVCPKCCRFLLELMASSDNWQQILEVADKGLNVATNGKDKLFFVNKKDRAIANIDAIEKHLRKYDKI